MTLLSALCRNCGHVRESHCKRGTTHFHPDARQYKCSVSHCLELVERDGHSLSCPCVRYEPALLEKKSTTALDCRTNW
jgi:hypothetical protein